ncbi:hypothetical protein BC937DRAFT_93022 [Endogone sp. FLAS-F59071]|nr:hypothetical protein BC937DRAFT_93022 [Endogone sp. FLAS-F59071]|eukprot:RUS15020.1 hypothetical protein BC937DRAFT_93022 [Endogone sp. FLAS-F59071]
MKFNLCTIPLAIIGFLAAQAFASPTSKPSVDKNPGKPKRADCVQTSNLAGDHYSAVQIALIAQNSGFTGNSLVLSVAIALAESSGWTRATLINTDCSQDRGLWQINNRWHSEVSDDQAFDPAQCSQAAYRISSSGSNWALWTTFTSGAYSAYMAEAQAAVSSLSGGPAAGNKL